MSFNFTIINSTFRNNTARGNEGYDDTIMFFMSNNFTIMNSIFTNSTAIWGGVIFGQGSNGITIINNTFTNNNTTAIGSGGGVIYCDDDNYVRI